MKKKDVYFYHQALIVNTKEKSMRNGTLLSRALGSQQFDPILSQLHNLQI